MADCTLRRRLQPSLLCHMTFCNAILTLPHQEAESIPPPFESKRGDPLTTLTSRIWQKERVLAPGTAPNWSGILCSLPRGTLVSRSQAVRSLSHTEKLLVGTLDNLKLMSNINCPSWEGAILDSQPSWVFQWLQSQHHLTIISEQAWRRTQPSGVQSTHGTVRDDNTLLLSH